MLSQLTTLVLDAIDQLQTAADEIHTRKVFFINGDGDDMSIQMIHEQNAALPARQISNSPDEVYLMYALITCQLWWQVSRFVGKDAQLKFGMSARHVYMYLYQQHARVCACVCVCVYVYTGMFPILDYTRKEVESCGTSINRAMCVMSSDQDPAEAESSRVRTSGRRCGLH